MRVLALLLCLAALPALAFKPTPAKKPVRTQPRAAAPVPVASPEPPPLRQPEHYSFETQWVGGQRPGAQSVYLYDRRELSVRSMVKVRDSFRAELYEGR